MAGFFKRLLRVRGDPERLSYESARAILETHEAERERELAGRPDTDPEMLYYLAERGDGPARRAVAANPSAPAQADRFLAGDSDPEVRAELAKKIGRLLPDLLGSERDRVCELTLDTLQRLADDQIPRVRAILAEEIKGLSCVPKSIIDAMARDAEAAVSVPVLEYSPLLSDNDLLEIVATARAQGALAAVARRRGLSEAVSEAIVASLDIPAVAALLANPHASVREDTLENIIDQARSIPEWQGSLVVRTDLSVRAMKRIAGFVGAALLERLIAGRVLDPDIEIQLKRALKQRLDRNDDGTASAEEKARAAIAHAYESGTLDEGFIEKTVESGSRDLLIEALAFLAQVPRHSVEKIFSSRSAKAITALAWYTSLTMRIAFKIQTLVVKLSADELLPARAGVSFPLSEDEMRWHLSYFGIPPETP